MTKRRKLLQLHQINKQLREKKILLFYQYNNVKTRDWELLRGELLGEVSSHKRSPTTDPLVDGIEGFFPFEAGSLERGSTISTVVVKNKIGQLCLAKRLATNLDPSLFKSKPTRDFPIRNQHQTGGLPINPTPAGSWHHEVISDSTISYGQGEIRKCLKFFQGPTFFFACNSHHEMAISWKLIGKKRDRYSKNHAILLGGLYYGKVVTHLDIAKLSALNSSIYASLPIELESKLISLLVGGVSYPQEELLRCLECRREKLLQSPSPPLPCPVKEGMVRGGKE